MSIATAIHTQNLEYVIERINARLNATGEETIQNIDQLTVQEVKTIHQWIECRLSPENLYHDGERDKQEARCEERLLLNSLAELRKLIEKPARR